MHRSLLPFLMAPEGGGTLTLTVNRQDGDEILEGNLTDAAGRVYPIEDGIPRLLPTELLAEQRSEIAARDSQVGDYDRMAFLHLFGKIEIPLTLKLLTPRADDRLLEGGCGTGRMSQALARGVKEMVAIDFSFESLRVNRQKLLAAGVTNVHLVQADLCHLPFTPGAFTRAVSCQVLEHVPGPEARCDAVAELSRVLRPNATLVLSAYKHSLFTRLFGKKEGAHDGGIPFFRFTMRELRDLLGTAFRVERISGVLVYLYITQCKKH